MRRLALAVCAGLVSFAACSSRAPATVGRSRAPVAAASPSTTTTVVTQAELARTLVATEAGIRDPDTPAGGITALGRDQQRAYVELVPRPEWDAEVLALVPDPLRRTVEANVVAGRELQALNGPVEPDRPLPRWRIVAPEPAGQLLAVYKAAGAATGVPWPYLAAIHFVETRMGRIVGDSRAGAQGPMQFIPTTWAVYGQGGDITSNRDSIFAAARLLRANGAPSDMARALHAYNDSPRYVTAVTNYAGQIADDERAYLGYHAWQVYYGSRLLPEGAVIG